MARHQSPKLRVKLDIGSNPIRCATLKIMNTYDNDQPESEGLDSTVLDYANIELLDIGESYDAENGEFTVVRESEGSFILTGQGNRLTFASSQILIGFLKGEPE